MSMARTELRNIPGLVRCETSGRDGVLSRITEMTSRYYPAEEVYGRFCTVQEHIECPVDDAFDYLADVTNLGEWTLSTRDFAPTATPGRWVGQELFGDDTSIHVEARADPSARTVDYHAAWDQAVDLWMIYLIRLVDAQLVLGVPGTVLIWTNCRHRNYDHNPYPEAAPAPDRVWVGELWHLFQAAHRLELRNLKAILEHRYGTAGVER